MENRKGNGIFLGIVSVATLIVAIIGATFAYFSASTESNTGAVGATAYEYNLSLSVNPIYPVGIAPALIPMEAGTKVKYDNGSTYEGVNNTNLLYALNVAEKKCVDDHGLQVCALYQVTITNQAVNPITLSGTLITNSNTAAEGEGRTAFKNLTYQALTGKHTDNSLVLKGESKLIAEEVNGETKIDDIFIPGATTNEQGDLVPGIGTSYVLIWLDEAGAGQSSEMGASFTGQLKYSSGTDSTNGLTGTFTLASPKTEPEDENTETGA